MADNVAEAVGVAGVPYREAAMARKRHRYWGPNGWVETKEDETVIDVNAPCPDACIQVGPQERVTPTEARDEEHPVKRWPEGARTL